MFLKKSSSWFDGLIMIILILVFSGVAAAVTVSANHSGGTLNPRSKWSFSRVTRFLCAQISCAISCRNEAAAGFIISCWRFFLSDKTRGWGGVELLKQDFCWVSPPAAVTPPKTLRLNERWCQWFCSSQLKPAAPVQTGRKRFSVCSLNI